VSAADLPVAARTPRAAGLAAGARAGELRLQRCGACGAWQYPPRELCRVCLAADLAWEPAAGRGRLVEAVPVAASLEPWFSAHLPWWIGKIVLECGVKVIAHLDADCRQPALAVQVLARIDIAGSPVLVALPEGAAAPAAPALEALLGAP